MKLGVEDAGPADRHKPYRAGPDHAGSTKGCISAPMCRTPTLPSTRRSERSGRSFRKPSWRVPLPSFATWRSVGGNLLQGTGAAISAMWRCPATGGSRERAAARWVNNPASRGSTATARCLAPARPASPPTRPICAWRWWRWTRMVKISNPSFDRLERIEDFFRLPGDTPNIQTRLGPDELITGIELPTCPPASGPCISRCVTAPPTPMR